MLRPLQSAANNRCQKGSNKSQQAPKVGLSGYFSNLPVEVKHLVMGLFSAMGSSDRVSGRAEIVDLRGPVARNCGKVQTFLGSNQWDEVLARYVAGEGVKLLAAEYQVHRNTIWRQAVKRGVVAG